MCDFTNYYFEPSFDGATQTETIALIEPSVPLPRIQRACPSYRTSFTDKYQHIDEFYVNGVLYPLRYDVVFVLTSTFEGTVECSCVELEQIKGVGNDETTAFRNCQLEFARLFEETLARRTIDYSREAQALWAKFVELVDLRRYRKEKPARILRRGRIDSITLNTLVVEWEDGELETFDLKKFPLPYDVDELKPNDWAKFIVERDFFTAELREFVSVKKFARKKLSNEKFNTFFKSSPVN